MSFVIFRRMTSTLNEAIATLLPRTSSGEPAGHKGITKWFNKILRVELVDGRVIFGTFMCTDNEPNIILTESEEFWKEQEIKAKRGDIRLTKRNVGMVVIPGRHILRILYNPRIQVDEQVSY